MKAKLKKHIVSKSVETNATTGHQGSNLPLFVPWSAVGPVFLLGVGPLWRYHLNDGELLHAFVQLQ